MTNYVVKFERPISFHFYLPHSDIPDRLMTRVEMQTFAGRWMESNTAKTMPSQQFAEMQKSHVHIFPLAYFTLYYFVLCRNSDSGVEIFPYIQSCSCELLPQTTWIKQQWGENTVCDRTPKVGLKEDVLNELQTVLFPFNMWRYNGSTVS